MNKKIFAFILSVSFWSGLFAQFNNINDYIVRIWTSNDQLPGNTVSDIIQSSDGYMYFGTYEGLVKFDGIEFKTLNKYSDGGNGQKYNFVTARSLFEDSRKNLWIGSNDEGIQRIGPDGEIRFTTDNGLPNNSVRSIIEDKFGNIWIGTASGVVYVTPYGKCVIPNSNADINISQIMVNQLYCDTAGRIWLISQEAKGLYVYSDFTFTRYEKFDFLGDYIPSSIVQDNIGNFWFGLSGKGIFKVGNGVVSNVKTDTFLDNETTWSIFPDDSGSIWFGTERGLVFYRDGEFSEYNEENTFAKASINKIIQDREGNIWIGTDKSGLGKISPGKFRMNNLRTAVNAICEDNEGLVWIGTDNGVVCYDGRNYVENDLTKLTAGIRVRHIGLANNGDLLVNCYSEPGLIRYSKKGIRSWTYDDGLCGNKTRVAIEIDNGDIYCGTTTGLSIITKDNRIENFTSDNGLDCDYVMWLYQDEYGFVWVGTDGGGIFIMRNGKILKKITTADGLAGNVIFKITQDSEGVFWVCTGTGISRFFRDETRFLNDKYDFAIVNITSENGLGSDAVFQMISDTTGNVWMISNRGISSVAGSDLQAYIAKEKNFFDVKYFTQNDGLKTNGANSTALSMLDKEGRIWFTLTDGFAIYDPYRARSAKALPLIQAVCVKIDDKEIYDFDTPIIIPPDSKHVQIEYAGLSFTASDRNRYTYKMDGFDDEFSELTDQRSVNYTNLPPGKYTFIVDMQNSEGDFSEKPVEISFIKQAHLYQLPIFWISLAIIVLGIIAIVFIGVNRVHVQRQLMLETKIQMATVELQMAKDDSDRLLKNILPVSIAEQLKGIGGDKTIANTCENVTVLFSDIVGFTNTTSNETAEDIVSSLNDLISRFDKRAASMGVEKIKTIGDAYMAACGVPVPNKNHAVITLKFAIGMYKDLAEYNKTAKIKFNIRIGLNTGTVIAGVIGKNKFIYDIWGDTVNVASRMESNCNPGHIRMTESVKKELDAHNVKFKFREEQCDVKGKGLMRTYEIPE